jgi:raffinose/stachyose/melibiose transport system substrate-binding protein
MTKFKKITAIIAVSLLVGVFVVACGGSDDPGGGSDRTVNAHVFQYKVDTIDQMQNLANTFAERFEGADIAIEVETIGGTGDYEGALAVRFAADDIPDMFALSGSHFVELYQEHLVDLSNEPWLDVVVDGLLDPVWIGDQMLGQPLAVEAYGYIYNADIFEELNLTAPTSFSELVAVAEALDAAGIRAFSCGYAEWWVLAQHFFNGAMLAEAGYDFVANVGITETFASQQQLMDDMVALLQLTAQFGGGEATLAIDYNTSLSDFATGRAAIIQQGTWIQPTLDELNPDMNVGIFGFMTNDGPDTGRIPVGNAGYWVISNTSDYVDIMKDFLTFMATDEYAINSIINDFQMIPAFTGVDYDLSTLGSIFAVLQPHIEAGNTSEWVWENLPPGFGDLFFSPFQQTAIGMMNSAELTEELDRLVEGAR